MAVRTVSQQGLERIAAFEGYRARAAALPDGRHTIGFGHVASARAGALVSRADALLLLRHDLQPIELALRGNVRAPLTQGQFDALASFAFNIGLEAFLGSDVLSLINAGEPITAALAMAEWRVARLNGRLITVDALVRRRVAEMDAFLTLPPDTMHPAAPTPVLKPQRTPASPAPPPAAIGPTAPATDRPEPSATHPDAGVAPAAPPQRPIDQSMAAIRARLQDVGVRPLASTAPPRTSEPPPDPADATGRGALTPDAPAPSGRPLLEQETREAPGAQSDDRRPPASQQGPSAPFEGGSPIARSGAPEVGGGTGDSRPPPGAGVPPPPAARLALLEPPLLETLPPALLIGRTHAGAAPDRLPGRSGTEPGRGLIAPIAVTAAGVMALAIGCCRLATVDRVAGAAALRGDVLIAAIGFVAALVGAAIAAERLARR